MSGKPMESEVYHRIVSSDPGAIMPPPESNLSLTPEEIDLIKRWIEQGAKYEPHWAFMKVEKPSVPAFDWGKNEIDAFIHAKIKAKGLEPNPEANSYELIKRASLDLTGLPPSPEILDKYAGFKGSNTYEKLLDELMALPSYGEKMGILWLDISRYSDSYGYQDDEARGQWPYRDWVIHAFNNNLPYDQFITWQLAGDLLPNATKEQILATAFNRNHKYTEEGGVIHEEYRVEYVLDKTNTFSKGILGLTMECAQCHDHKYDPFTAKDFYSIAAYFADMRQWGVYADYSYTPEPELRGINNDSPFPPEIVVSSKALASRIDEEVAGIKALKAGVADSDPRYMAYLSKHSQYRDLNGDTAPLTLQTPEGTDWHTPEKAGLVIDIPRSAVMLAGIEVTIRQPQVPSTINLSLKQGNVTLPFWHGIGEPHTPTTQNGFERIGIQSGWRITSKAPRGEAKAVYWLPRTAFTNAGPLKLTLSGTTSDVRIRVLPVHAINPDVLNAPLERDPKAAFLLSGAGLEKVSNDISTRQRSIVQCRGGKTPVMVTEGTNKGRQARILARGNWMDTSGALVGPATPAFLTSGVSPSAQPASRLELASWITSRNNPLTARVLVNRFWRLFFGTGISASVEDFGAQGEAPTNPALLDWLASSLMDNGWNMRTVMREIVLSDAYKRSSKPLPVHLVKDPQNRYFARQSPRRLDAEFIRDNALAIAGILDSHVGGPPVKPFQPIGYYANLQFPDRDYTVSTRGDQYRRGLYTHWQRTFLHPGLAAFDAPSREEACPVRNEANTPQQALTLLNDPVYVEAARGLANLMYASIKPGTGSDNARIDWLMQRVRGASPSGTERNQLKTILAESRKSYTINQIPGRDMLRTGSLPSRLDVDPIELAAYTNVCRVLLNLHETITRY